MRQLYYGQAQFLVGDELAEVLLEYAAVIARRDTADNVSIHVLGPDGNFETTELLLTQSTMITAETTRSQLEEPENAEAVAYMRKRITALTPTEVRVVADDRPPSTQFDDQAYDDWPGTP